MPRERTVRVRVSADGSGQSIAGDLERRIPEEIRRSEAFRVALPRILACAEDLSATAAALGRGPATLRVEREFRLPGLRVCVVLHHPERPGIVERIASALGRRPCRGR